MTYQNIVPESVFTQQAFQLLTPFQKLRNLSAFYNIPQWKGVKTYL